VTRSKRQRTRWAYFSSSTGGNAGEKTTLPSAFRLSCSSPHHFVVLSLPSRSRTPTHSLQRLWHTFNTTRTSALSRRATTFPALFAWETALNAPVKVRARFPCSLCLGALTLILDRWLGPEDVRILQGNERTDRPGLRQRRFCAESCRWKRLESGQSFVSAFDELQVRS
jgi:hypothetical protein